MTQSIFLGFFFASPIEYSPFPHPNSNTIGLSFLKARLFHFPFNLRGV